MARWSRDGQDGVVILSTYQCICMLTGYVFDRLASSSSFVIRPNREQKPNEAQQGMLYRNAVRMTGLCSPSACEPWSKLLVYRLVDVEEMSDSTLR